MEECKGGRSPIAPTLKNLFEKYDLKGAQGSSIALAIHSLDPAELW